VLGRWESACGESFLYSLEERVFGRSEIAQLLRDVELCCGGVAESLSSDVGNGVMTSDAFSVVSPPRNVI
jgi:hypothetical protein